MTPKESLTVDLPIGEFIGSKEEIEKVKDANLNYQTASFIEERYDNPNAIWPFVVNLPESNSIDPDTVPQYIKGRLIACHLWDGKGKINFFAMDKEKSLSQQKENEAYEFLSKSIKKYPKLFKDASEKVESIKQKRELINTKDFLNSISDKNERKIAEDLIFIRRITGITPSSEANLRGLRYSRITLKQIRSEDNFKSIKEWFKKEMKDSVIGIKVNGGRAILVYGMSDDLLTQVRMFAKVGDTYKLYNIEGVKHTRALDKALSTYWRKKIKSKQSKP